MEKKHIFKGTVEALQNGPLTIEQIGEFTGHSPMFISDEIDRIMKCGPVKNWIVVDDVKKTYSFINKYKKMSLNEVVLRIKNHYITHRSSIDIKLDLQRRAPRSFDMDYNLLSKLLELSTNYDEVIPFGYMYPKEQKVIFDFSTIDF